MPAVKTTRNRMRAVVTAELGNLLPASSRVCGKDCDGAYLTVSGCVKRTIYFLLSIAVVVGGEAVAVGVWVQVGVV
jgi:hypothetical protein